MSRPTDVKKAKFVIFWPRKGETWQPCVQGSFKMIPLNHSSISGINSEGNFKIVTP